MEFTLYSYAENIKESKIPDLLNLISVEFDKWIFVERNDYDLILGGGGVIFSIEEKGPDRFNAVQNRIDSIKINHIGNLTDEEKRKMPIFLGSSTFSEEMYDAIWSDFNPTLWFIPEVIFFKIDENIRLIINRISKDESEHEEVRNNLKQLLESVGMNNDTPFSSRNNIRLNLDNDQVGAGEWKRVVRRGIQHIQRGDIKKVVISRMIKGEIKGELSIQELLFRLRRENVGSYTYLYGTGNSLFFGISPERLVKFSKNRIECDAIAGTTLNKGNEIFSDKHRSEQNFVIDHIITVLKGESNEIAVTKIPDVKRLPHINHLYTEIAGIPNKKLKIFNILHQLHPTPAVGGTPLNSAIKFINREEGYDRGMYSGFIGWFNLSSAGEFIVAIRSSLLIDRRWLYAFAGAGIVSGSKPDHEYKETEDKLKTVINLFNGEESKNQQEHFLG